MIDRLITYMLIAFTIYSSAAYIFVGEDKTLFFALWCLTMLEIRSMKMPKIYIGIEKEQKQEEKDNDT